MTRQERYWLMLFIFNVVAFFGATPSWVSLLNFVAALISGWMFWSYGKNG